MDEALLKKLLFANVYELAQEIGYASPVHLGIKILTQFKDQEVLSLEAYFITAIL